MEDIIKKTYSYYLDNENGFFIGNVGNLFINDEDFFIFYISAKWKNSKFLTVSVFNHNLIDIKL